MGIAAIVSAVSLIVGVAMLGSLVLLMDVAPDWLAGVLVPVGKLLVSVGVVLGLVVIGALAFRQLT
jgi:hypothetical protein